MPQRYLAPLRRLAAADNGFACIGSFGLWLWGHLPDGSDIPDADIAVRRDPLVFERLARTLRDMGWMLELWGKPVATIPSFDVVVAHHYLRARTGNLCIDLSVCDLALPLEHLLAGASLRHGIPVAALADIVATKQARGLARDREQLRFTQPYSGSAAAFEPAEPDGRAAIRGSV